MSLAKLTLQGNRLRLQFADEIAITPDKVPLGTVSMQIWKRSGPGIRTKRRDKLIEKKRATAGLKAIRQLATAAPLAAVLSVLLWRHS